MKKTIIILFAFIFVCLFGSLNANTASFADYGIPYETYTRGADGALIATQTAYIPVGYLAGDARLDGPRDIYYEDGLLYIADAGNKRIIVLDTKGAVVREYVRPEFVSPEGVYRRRDKLYIADKGANAVFILDLSSGELLREITKPSSPLFGQSNKFVPIKVAVDEAENIYIVGEGSTSGIIHVNYLGEFVGYIGINPVRLSFRKILYNLFVKSSDLAASRPPAPSNIALGSKGSILTTNDNVSETFKRLNLQGVNTLGDDTFYPAVTLADIWLSRENYIYLVAATGQVYEYDETGNLIFTFNTNDYAKTQTLGLSSGPSGVCVDDEGKLYILDKNYNMIHVYQRTVFVSMVHEALLAYNNGRYVASKPLWTEIIKHNASFALAHSALGEAYLKEGNYDFALEEFYIARDYNGYSNAYWEIRNNYIQNYLYIWVIVFAALYALYKAAKYIFKKKHIAFALGRSGSKMAGGKIFGELRDAVVIIRKPGELFYRIRRYNFGYIGAFIVYLLFAGVYVIDVYLSGFLFRAAEPGGLLSRLLIISVIFLLYIIMNYLLSTFSDGEGKFKTVFIASCYALIPFIVFTLPMTFLSHVLTYNESFIYRFYHDIIGGWTIFLLIFSMKRVHNYTFAETVKNVLLTIFAMAVVIIVGLMVYSFIGQLWDFIISVIREVAFRG